MSGHTPWKILREKHLKTEADRERYARAREALRATLTNENTVSGMNPFADNQSA